MSGEPLCITVEIRNTYGQDRVYPVCEKAKLFANIAGTRELTRNTVSYIKQLGYHIQVKPPEQPLFL